MARPSKPYFDKKRGRWVCSIEGRFYTLGETVQDRDTRFHELMAARGKAGPAEKADARLWVLKDLFLDYQSSRVVPAALENDKFWVLRFVAAMGRDRLASSVRPDDVTDWLRGYRGRKGKPLSSTSKNIAITKIRTMYKRAVRSGWLSENPLIHLDAPPALEREFAISEGQYNVVMADVTGRKWEKTDLADLLEFLWETGVRPSEAYRLRRDHIDINACVAKLPGKTTEATGKDRKIILNTNAIAVVKRRIEKSHGDLVFSHNDGKPWTQWQLGSQLRRIGKRVGVPELCAGCFRKALATDLATNHPPAISAMVLGHKNLKTVNRFYIKLQNRPEVVRAAIESVRPVKSTAPAVRLDGPGEGQGGGPGSASCEARDKPVPARRKLKQIQKS